MPFQDPLNLRVQDSTVYENKLAGHWGNPALLPRRRSFLVEIDPAAQERVTIFKGHIYLRKEEQT